MGKCLLICFLAAAMPAASQPAQPIAQAIERHYNSLRSLEAQFDESVAYAGQNITRVRRRERGTLYLLRPRRMRWDYTDPAGKLFVSDGKMFYLYNPNSNQVQRIKPKEAEDLRAPLAFLLGKLDFHKDFGPLSVKDTTEGIELTAQARSDADPYGQVVFTVDPSTYAIRRIVVDGRDGLVTTFHFSGETANPPLEARLFHFEAPPGAELVEAPR